MEDRVTIKCERDGGKLAHTFFGVYDGHGGSSAADYVRDHLYDNLVMHELFESNDDNDVMTAIKESFVNTHHDMLKVVGMLFVYFLFIYLLTDTWPRTASGYRSTAGTTASIVLLRNGKLYTGHVGDSAVIIGQETLGLRSCLCVININIKTTQ
jgi:protein phosphatase 1D